MLGRDRSTQNAAFFTILEKKCKEEELFVKLELLFDAIDKQTFSYWFKFGYKYLAMLNEYTYDEIREYIEKSNFVKNKYYADSIVGIYFGERYLPNSTIIADIEEGIRKFYSDAENVDKSLFAEIAFAGVEYLADHAGPYDVKNIYEAVRKIVIDGEEHFLPVTPREKYKFGVVYPWPGTDTAETELLARMAKAAENIGFECARLSDFGQILDEKQANTDEMVEEGELDYVMTTHYESHKSMDCYYYHLLWNPPDIPLNTAYYEGRVLDNYIMNDDYLIYDFGGMSNHLRSMLINKPRTLEGASTFVGSFPKSAIMQPNLEDPKLFYCGMNWEKASGDSNRHAGLFELLDKTNKVKFYGPDIVESWGGIRPWEGYQCYQYSIPFDGFSILKEINSCGICLAISSDAHRRAGAVTNRAYEACAAGAVIISDNNVFMEEYFGDSVLYVTYNKEDPEDTYKQIMEKYQWIVSHKEEALEMARKSQKIFVDRFCMEKGMLDVMKNHYSRFAVIANDLFAKNEEQVVLATRVLSTQEEAEIEKHLERTVWNISHQYYRNIVLAVVCDTSVAEAVSEYAKKACVNMSVVAMPLYDEKGSRCVTDGQAIRYAQQRIAHDFFINTREDEVWFYDHITTLVRAVEDEPDSMGAYAGMLSEDEKGFRRNYMFEPLSYTRVYLENHPNNLPVPGQFLFRTACEEDMPEYMLGCLDGLEHVAYVALLWIRYHKKLVFSKRMTCAWRYFEKIVFMTVLDFSRQLRFIRGLVRYELPSYWMEDGGGSVDKSWDWRKFMLTMPLSQSIRVRFWRKLACRFNSQRGIGKLIYRKYMKKLDDYNELVNKIQGV